MDKDKVIPEEVGKRIRHIRYDLGLSMTQFAKRIDKKAMSGTISNWETGKNLPNNERIKRIAELGGVSVNYLLYGIDDRFENGESITYYLGTTIHQIRDRLSLSQEEFGKLFNPPADRKTVSNWEKRISIPNSERLQIIADLEIPDDNPGAHVTINDLIGTEEMSDFWSRGDAIISDELNQYKGPLDKKEIMIQVSQKMHHIASKNNLWDLSKSEMKKHIKRLINETIDELEKNSKYYPKSDDNAKSYAHDLLADVLIKIDEYYKAGYWSDEDITHPLSDIHLITKLDYEKYKELYGSIHQLIEQLEK